MATITFLGATGTVTGSRYLVEAHDRRVLVDAGLFQGRKELRQRNWAPFPIDPKSLSAVIITHAHIDHSGYLPRLVREGFDGPTFVTTPTRRLLPFMLTDAAHLQEEEARYANKVKSTRHKPALPLFTVENAQQAIRTLQPLPFGAPFTLWPGAQFTFHRQGHILGAAAVEFRLKAGGGDHTTVYFSGDVGRYAVPVLQPPTPYPGSTYLVVESTYGNRHHDPGDPGEQLGEAVNEAVARGGMLVIPAFAIDRTQEVLFLLRELIADEAIKPVPIFLDSPMALEATTAYRDCIREHDAEARALRESGIEPL